MHASRQPRSATAPPLAPGLSRSVPAAGYARRRPHGGASSATGPSGMPPPPPPPPRPAWVGIADRKLPLESSAAEEDVHPRRAATQGLRRGPSGKENRAAAAAATVGVGENGRRGERRRANPYSSSRAGQPRSSSIPSRGDKPSGGDGHGHVQRRGKSAPPRTAVAAAATASRVNPRTNKRRMGARVGPSASGNNGNAGARITASSANTGARGGGGGHPPPYDSLGRQRLRRDVDGASSTARRRWRPADGWADDNHVGGDGGDGDGGSNTEDNKAWAEKPLAAEAAVSTRREDGGDPRRGVCGREDKQARGTVAARRFPGEPFREPFSRPFSRQERGAETESQRAGLEGRQGEREGEEEEGGLEERTGATASGDDDKGQGRGEGEEDSLDDRLPFMLASLKRVALTVHDLQGRCARLSHGEVEFRRPASPAACF